jgi:hypothetical protein
MYLLRSACTFRETFLRDDFISIDTSVLVKSLEAAYDILGQKNRCNHSMKQYFVELYLPWQEALHRVSPRISILLKLEFTVRENFLAMD